MKKKILTFGLLLAVGVSMLSTNALAAKHQFSFRVYPSPTPPYGKQWAAGNPKSDNAQMVYTTTTSNTIGKNDIYWYAVRDQGGLNGRVMANYVRIYGNGRKNWSYNIRANKGQKYYLEASTDRYTCSSSGVWNS